MKYRWRVKIPALQFLTLSHYFKDFMIQTPDTMELFLSQRGFSVWHVIRAVRHSPHAISLRMWPQTDRLCLSQFLRSSTYIYLSICFIPTHPFSLASCLPLATPYETITKLLLLPSVTSSFNLNSTAEHVNQPINQSIFDFIAPSHNKSHLRTPNWADLDTWFIHLQSLTPIYSLIL